VWSGLDTDEKLLRIGYVTCFALALGAVGPWAKLGPTAANGVDGDGIFSLLLALMAGFTLWRWSDMREQEWLYGVLILGGLSLALAAFNAYDLRRALDFPGVDIGWGLILTIVASAVLIAIAARLAYAGRY
jgi:peptidoglycan/LPS O-acetylase OafA/YrhL